MHVFTYGTLMFPEVWQAVVGREFTTVRGRAAGFEIFRVRDALYPGILASTGTVPISSSPREEMGLSPSLSAGDCSQHSTLNSQPTSVAGIIYLDVDDESVARLDRFESDFYQRRPIIVTTGDGQRLDAQAYVVPEENRDVLTAETWSADEFKSRGDLARFVARYSGFNRLNPPLPPGEAG